ncbi:MAG: OmpA family protein [Bacteroidota bacterium]
MTRSLPLIFFLLVTTLSGLHAQNVYQSKAARHEKKNHYADASKAYLGLHEAGNRDALLSAAMNLYHGHQFDDALQYFVKADSMTMINDPDEIFAYFECLKWQKRYEDADKLIRTHADNHVASRELSLQDNKLPLYRKLQEFNEVKVTPLNFNTEYSEISPTLYQGWLYFVSTVPTTGNKAVHRINNQPFYNLYAVPVDSDMKGMETPSGNFGEPEKTITHRGVKGPSLPNGMNQKHHDGPIYAAPSGNIVFFNTNWSAEKRPKGKEREINLLMYYITKTGDVWSQPVSMPFNSFTYSNQHPYFDENTSTLYFSSNMPGGYGEFDIWKTSFTDGKWSKPENLGERVNSPKEEVFPSMGPDGNLIISSNGWPGLGGLDLFVIAEPSRDPVNMTAALNTERDDFGLCFKDSKLAYLSSNRSGGAGDDDIYSVEFDIEKIKEYMRPPDKVVQGTVRDSETRAVLEGVKISFSGTVNRTMITNPEGLINDKFPFNLVDPRSPELVIRYEKDGYETKEVKVTSWPDDQPMLDVSESLVASKKPAEEAVADAGKTVQVRMIDNQKFIVYFDFDRFNIRKDAAEILAKVAYVLLEEYEAAEVLLTGHTDSRGSVAYNEKLSKRRVESAKKWLVEKGISAKRIRTAHKGELQLAVWCQNPLNRERNPDTCLTEKEHQLNRRVEVEIMNVPE